MSHNSFGNLLKFTTWGESHGEAIGCVVDGFPSGITIDTKFIQTKLNLRKPGQSKFTTQRKEKDEVKILSGVFEGKSTGAPISMIIPDGKPSTTHPIASPWLSPHVVNLNKLPKELCDIV